ncbi:DUF4399 domain-containing protein [Dokdonella immobilis]|uniref:DUF4399 domain-containing protein n=1 Tax=Dokdonella immobilis TaxID=578942 RepID=A0A1I4Y9W2_9GAMM|nr:DUF4399 domain-containing protein [Dokdonella immobilis]SFN34847.1 protein of unknown function [Dokdonella immobilis]
MRELNGLIVAALIAAGITVAGVARADETKAAALPRSEAPAGVELYFITPKDGDTVGEDVVVRFGLRGMGVSPAGMQKEKTGHHHLLIDVEGLPPLDRPIPADANHVHFGGGQTETTVKLTPGKHTLQLDLADALHMQFDPPIVSKKITINVK